MRTRAIPLVVAALFSVACSKKKSGGWLVGEHGLMVRIDDGQIDRYPLDVDSDLVAIACRGDSEAWTVGADGTVLRTLDAGKTWTSEDAGTMATLRSVATASGDTVWIAGDGGTLLRDLEPVEAGATDFTAVATDASGRLALVAGADGSILRIGSADPIQVLAPGGPALRGVALTPDGDTAVAVGDAGTVLRSSDGGATWTPVASETDADLRAVRISSDAALVVAVGDAIVRMDGEELTAEPATRSLFALHLEAGGHGMAVGESGMVLGTEDLGESWSALDAGTDGTFLGVDDLHGEPHL